MCGRQRKAAESRAACHPGSRWLTSLCFPSFIAYLFFNRGIELIGATRAGQSWHLMPVFGSILAVLFLGETFYAYHAIGIALIAGGIVLASIKATGVADGARAQRNVKTRPRANA